MVEPHSSNFRVITTIILGVRIFREFTVLSELKVIAENQAIPVDLESYVKKLNNSRRRVMLVNNILQNVQVSTNRCQKVGLILYRVYLCN